MFAYPNNTKIFCFLLEVQLLYISPESTYVNFFF